ncbi:hypothetical protein JM83_0186 [Gillisia sp. Hel_I_86]|nr:hypothetical protein JM83_0186 [Gillisia sp. Hel_I_86]
MENVVFKMVKKNKIILKKGVRSLPTEAGPKAQNGQYYLYS